MKSSPSRTSAALILMVVLVLLGLVVVGVAATPASAETSRTDVVRNAIENYVRPAYADFATAAKRMEERQSALCAAPSRHALLEARQGFAALVTAFSRVEYVRFGPVMEDNRVERILFWPDRRGIALRQVQAILAAEDESAADMAGLKGKSVAVQGLNALEFVLFGTGAEELGDAEGGFRCRYGAAIAGNLQAVATDISTGWQAEDGIASAMTRPSAASPAYRTIEDSLQAITGVFALGFEAMRDLRIQPAYGPTIERSNPKAWIYQRSELTDTSLQTNFVGLSELYDTSKIADLLPEPDKWMAASIAFEFGNAGRAFQTIGVPLAEASSDPERRDRVGYLLILTQSLQGLFVDQLSPALGLSAGFSSLDGD